MGKINLNSLCEIKMCMSRNGKKIQLMGCLYRIIPKQRVQVKRIAFTKNNRLKSNILKYHHQGSTPKLVVLPSSKIT